ncbi:MAG: alkaline phosphatase family protein [Gemmatimonadota bacterium]
MPSATAPEPLAPGRRVAILGLDAFDIDLVERWMTDGRLPNLAALRERGAWSRMASTLGMFTDSPWPSFHAGVSPATHAFYMHLQLASGTRTIERVDAHHCKTLPFWAALRGTALRVVALDVPKTFPIEGVEGVQICGWGEHYPLLPKTTALPAAWEARIVERFGAWPHPEEIPTPKSRRVERKIGRTLRDNLEKKVRATEALLTEEPWDLFLSVFAEGHYAGHQFYHLHEPSHWGHEPDAPADLREALPRAYVDTDAAIGRLLQSLPPDVTLLVTSVHGLATNYSANHLMDAVLERMGLQVAAAPAQAANGQPEGALGRALRLSAPLRRLLPASLRAAINRRLVPQAAHDRAHAAAFTAGKDWEKTRVFFLPSDDFDATLRVNLRGREPDGIVEPGEVAALHHHLRAELRQLVNPATGRSAVHDVARTSDVYQGPRLLDLPDFVVQWASDAPIIALEHPRLGRFEGPPWDIRKTQHAHDGFLLAAGPGIVPGARLDGLTTLDIGPTVLHLLGQPVPPEMEGRVVVELLARRTAEGEPGRPVEPAGRAAAPPPL